VPGWADLINTGLQGWIARQRDADGRWVAAPDHNMVNGRWVAEPGHTWIGAAEVELDPSDDRGLWAKRGSGNLASTGDGRTADLFSRADLGSCELYLEFLIPAESRSGVYLLGQYEIELADSYGVADDELDDEVCGAISARRDPATKELFDGHPPLTNAALPASEWQVLELTFRAPRFDDEGRKIANARFERVVLNDTLIHENVELSGPTRGAVSEVEVARGPLRLQGSGGPVAFRDVRMRTIFE
jgi:hypothetical protein